MCRPAKVEAGKIVGINSYAAAITYEIGTIFFFFTHINIYMRDQSLPDWEVQSISVCLIYIHIDRTCVYIQNGCKLHIQWMQVNPLNGCK